MAEDAVGVMEISTGLVSSTLNIRIPIVLPLPIFPLGPLQVVIHTETLPHLHSVATTAIVLILLALLKTRSPVKLPHLLHNVGNHPRAVHPLHLRLGTEEGPLLALGE